MNRIEIDKYLKDQRAIINSNRHVHFDGSRDAKWSNWGGQGMQLANNYIPADGSNTPPPGYVTNTPPSQPYVVYVSNTTNSNQTIDLFGAFEYLNNPPNGSTWSGGVLTTSSVTISTLLANTSYQQLLATSGQNPFTVAQTRILCNNNSSQLNVPISVSSSNPIGSNFSNQLILIQDIYQQVNNQVIVNTPYLMDMNTKLTFIVLGGSVITLYLYPQSNFNSSRTLIEQAPGQTYGAPQGIQQQTIQVAQAGARPGTARLM